MIFNPLFINESGNNKLLVPSSKKLSQNKYLFSDIVKVVMNPVNDIQKFPKGSEGHLALRRGFSVKENQDSVKMKLNFLKDVNPEKIDKSLTEILPNEIVKLLTREGNTSDDDVAISYLSREILGGELQTFVKELLGADFINNHLNSNNGLLLSLEDNTSAVNIELAKIDSKYNANSKVAVQTVVVPFKSKLFSTMAADDKELNLFRFNNQETLSLNKFNNQKLTPVVSVCTFKLGTENFQSLTQALNKTKDLRNSSEIKNLLSTQLSEINKDLSKDVKYANQKLNRELFSKNLSKSKLFQDLKNKSDFTVNNITILKKSSSNAELIDVKKTEESKNIFNNRESSSPNSRSSVSFNEYDNKLVMNKDSIRQSTGEKDKENPNLKVDISSKSKPVQNFEQKNTLSQKQNQIYDGKKEPILDSLAKGSVNRDSKVNNENSGTTRADQIVNKTDDKIFKENISKENYIINKRKNEVSNGEKNLESINSKKINGENKSDNSIQKILSDNKPVDNLTKIKTGVDKSFRSNAENKELLKEDIKNSKNSDRSDNIKNSGNFSTSIKNLNPSKVSGDFNQTNEAEGNEISRRKDDTSAKINQEEPRDKNQINNTNIGITENAASGKDKKELSVKVKGEIKSVSDKNFSSKVDSKLNSYSESSAQSERDDSLKNNSPNENQNSNKIENELNKTENSFLSSINKINSSKQIILNDSQTLMQNNTAAKIVKSVELIKELTKFLTKKEKGSLTFNIKPEHLGQLKITLDSLDNILKARIEVENEQAKQLLEKNIDKLQQELNNNGVRLNSLNISLSNSKRHKDQKELKNKQNNNSKNLGQVGESEEESHKKSFGYNTYEYIA